MNDEFSTDLAPLPAKPKRTTFDAFEAANWTPKDGGQFLTFRDLFEYHGEAEDDGAFEFTLSPADGALELTANHTVRASHLDDFTDEVLSVAAAMKEIRSILKQWQEVTDEGNRADAAREAEDEE